MALAKIDCRACRKPFRPVNRRHVRCAPCRTTRSVHFTEPSKQRHTASTPVEVPTVAGLPIDVDVQNRTAVEFVLRLARQARTATALPTGRRDEYVRSLIEFATDTAAGKPPSRRWQLDKLGHLIIRYPEMRPRGTVSTGHARTD